MRKRLTGRTSCPEGETENIEMEEPRARRQWERFRKGDINRNPARRRIPKDTGRVKL